MRVQFDEMRDVIERALRNGGADEKQAKLMSEVYATSSLKGVYSHGLNRVARLISFVDRGYVDPKGKMELIAEKGAVKNYDGNLGFGILNAMQAAKEAAKLAKEFGIGMVSVRNTTHWMRGGSYAEMIADEGLIGMAWTNVESVMPVWGSDEASIGNNPIGIAIPSEDGPVLLDMACALYSYGKLQTTRLLGEQLPYPGGYNKDNELTTDPAEIEETSRVLPIGYWKGSGLAIALDLMAALLANGKAGVHMDQEDRGNCTSCSQIFIAFDPSPIISKEDYEKTVADVKNHVHSASPIDPKRPPSYPGEGMVKREQENREKGIPVDEQIWNEVKRLAGDLSD